MAGRGFPPKPEERRARRNKNENSPLKIVPFTPKKQPQLPKGIDWCKATKDWWKVWGASPLSADFSATDWSFLADTALLHQQLWGEGNINVLPELRLRVAKFGATPEDRARLRIQFAHADNIEEQSAARASLARSRANLRQLKSVGE